MIANLMVFYKGGLSYTDLQSMPIPELFRYHGYASRINREMEKAAK